MIPNYKSFLNRIFHIGKRYYVGNQWNFSLIDKRGESVCCNKCERTAFEVEEGKVFGMTYRIPLCQKHLEDGSKQI